MNTVPPSAGAGRVLGVLLRDSAAAFSPFQLPLTLSDCVGRSVSHTLWPSDVFALCEVSRHWHFIAGDWTPSLPRNGAKRKRLAILAVTFRGRAPATICNNQPDTHAPSTPRRKRNTETRARGCMVRMGLNVSWQPVQRHLRVWVGQSFRVCQVHPASCGLRWHMR